MNIIYYFLTMIRFLVKAQRALPSCRAGFAEEAKKAKISDKPSYLSEAEI